MIEDQPSSTHPPLPPTTEEQRFQWLRLLRSRRVGVSTFHRLMAEHRTAAAALDALPEVARSAGVKDYRICPEAVVVKELSLAKRAKAEMLTIGDPSYPTQLSAIKDAPPVLWSVGRRKHLNKPCVALVGARNASSLGTRMAALLAKELGDAGWVTVSGLARGVDASVHRASIETGTIAVQAGGVDIAYPVENAHLFEDVGRKGLRLSEDPIGLNPSARYFPKRNRIISGLTQATIVIEAAVKSGSLITARTALDQGRDVMAVPGHPFDPRAGGCNLLIRDGATLVRTIDDVLEALETAKPVTPHSPKAPKQRKLDLRTTHALHQEILARLSPTPVPEDDIAEALRADSGTFAAALTELELDGSVTRHSGGLLSKAG